jgi:demethylmenaquinone methyltransferase/2-methoxy-6-polyprenyl-1,4-benzoquinol methylase
MPDSFYQPGVQRSAKVQELFTRIAPRYDLINDLQSFGLHRCWKNRLIALAEPKSGERALDLCTGTGDVAFALARNGAASIGLDFNQAMLAIASARASTAPASGRGDGPAFLCGDAMRLPFADNSFAIVSVAYGLRNLADWEQGLREMFRVGAPGCRLLVLDFGKPQNALWRTIYFAYLKIVVPLFGKIFCGDSATYRYIFESLKNYPGHRGVAAKMSEMGCREVRSISLLGGVMGISVGKK